MYGNEVAGQAAIVGPKPKAPGKAPVTIKPKGGSEDEAPGGPAVEHRGSG